MPVIDEEKLGAAIARGMKPAEKTEPVADEKSELPADEQRNLKVLEAMEKANPEKYKGVSETYMSNLAALQDYAAKWQEEHPGEEFDENADEHKDFMAKREIEWDDNDFTEALADIKAEEKIVKRMDEVNKKFETIDQKERLQAAAPKVNAAKVASAKTFFAGMEGDFAKVFDEKGVLNVKHMEGLRDSDPLKFSIILTAAQRLENLVSENYKLFNGLVPYIESNPVHQAISKFAISKEQQLTAKPANEQLDDRGRLFKTAAEFYKLPVDQRNRYWTFSREDLDLMMASTQIKYAKTTISAEEKRFDSIAKARGLKKGDAASASAAPAARPAEEAEEEVVDDKPASPSARGTPRVAVVAGAGGNGSKNPLDLFIKSFLG